MTFLGRKTVNKTDMKVWLTSLFWVSTFWAGAYPEPLFALYLAESVSGGKPIAVVRMNGPFRFEHCSLKNTKLQFTFAYNRNQQPITWSLHLPYNPFESTLSGEKLFIEIVISNQSRAMIIRHTLSDRMDVIFFFLSHLPTLVWLEFHWWRARPKTFGRLRVVPIFPQG